MSEFLASPIGVLALTVAKALALLVPLLKQDAIASRPLTTGVTGSKLSSTTTWVLARSLTGNGSRTKRPSSCRPWDSTGSAT